MKMLSPHYTNLLPEQRAGYLYLKNIHNKTHKNKFNFAEVTTGNPGSGKTKSKILTSWALNPKRFNENFYCNTAKEFLDCIDDSRTGDTLIWDECGVSLSSRRWHSLSNILTGETLQTYRYNKLIVFFVTPDLSFIDIQARKLINAFVETKRYDLTKTFNWTYKIQVNRKTGDVYFPYFRAIVEGRLCAIPKIIFPSSVMKMIPEKLVKACEEKELDFKERLRKKNLKLLEIIEGEAVEKRKTIYDMINEVQEDKNKFMNEKGRIDFYLIQTHFGIGKNKAIQIKKFLEKKEGIGVSSLS